MILVTGGSGLLGAHLLYDLLRKHPRVRASKRPHSSMDFVKKVFAYYSNDAQALFEKIEWVEMDLDDIFSIEEALKGIDRVYHCAAVVSFHKKQAYLMQQTNVLGTKNLVDACLHSAIAKLIHVSSIAALGRAEKQEMTTEETPWKDSDKTSLYSHSKKAGELEVWRGMAEGLNAVIVNPSVIIGPGDWSQGSPQLFSLVHNGLKYYSHGINGYVYVRDVSKAMIALMESDIKDERFIINGEDLSYLELFNMMAKSLNKPYPSKEIKPWMAEIAWRALKAKSWFTQKAPSITKATARTFLQTYSYSSQKLLSKIDFQYTSMQQAIYLSAQEFLKDKSSISKK
ncbi:MAG: hypothetical protein B7C24_01785 [Bacteroidetes bacterium 4572_77]|nr:MAG: hypothetical protein B7C24_01785 [Bacteroidetes bacterium 4572_77]